MLITILISGIIITFLIEYFDDRKQRKRVFESAKSTISQSNKELQQINSSIDFAAIESILLDRFIQNISTTKKSNLPDDGTKKTDTKIKILSYDDFCKHNIEAVNLREVLQTEGPLLFKRKRIYYYYHLVNNFHGDLLIIEICTKKHPMKF
ncbi:MAG: hypothetical protein RBR68_15975 [Tenuifilaceae bacterium]|jgi:hypothetical protein|nr:hypothetical protein [Tenuifilaceae bacterium]